eukprot:TRINITY_DN2072_c0_g1_i1.p1 TRINITY_DN2072_c0_g1~~TRINITY_DN2072_c0_g1_i1.p1  ORF type:complete len:931 (-),score=272.47 TRINITY_DN2072_c0_g1_i1:40-2832(-)
MSNLRNASKYKHTVASIHKKELWYPDIKPNSSSGDYNSIAASSKWIAISWMTNGTVGILSLEESGKRKALDVPIVHAHSAPVTDLTFDPFDDSRLCTASDDAMIKLWSVPDDLVQSSGTISNALLTLSGHKKRVDCVQFHPNARHLLASGSTDKSVRIWDLEAGKEAINLEGKHDDVVHSIAWNWNGDLLATSSKDKKVRVIDVRANQVVQVGEGHQGVKASRVIWLGDQNKLFTTGFSKMRDRQFAFWDASNLSKSLVMSNLDNSTGVLDVYYDNDSSLLFLAGKGDGGIKVFEVEEKAPYYRELSNVTSDVPQKSTAFLPKRSMDLMNTEIARILKLGANAVVPVGFAVPRKSKTEFQEDLYPPTRSNEPSQTAQEWFAGETKPPKLVQLKADRNPDKFWYDDKDAKTSSPSTTKAQTSSSSAPNAQTAAAASSSPAQGRTPTDSPNTNRPVSGNFDTARSPTSGKYEANTVQVVRSSKYRHIVGKGTKQEICYVNLKAYPAGNNSVIRNNTKYFSVPVQGAGGRVAVVPLSKKGRQPDSMPVIECGSDCLDFDFSLFNESLFATVTESAHIQVWRIPEGGLTTTVRTPEITMKGHTRRVTAVDFHPNAANVLVTSAGDLTIRLWDVEKSEEKIKLEGPTDAIQSVSWNWDGSLMASSSKDKEMRIYDPRTNNITQRVEAHDGIKGFKVNWLGEREGLLTVGFTKGSQRQLALWDLKNLSKPLARKEIDNGAGIITPFYDPDTGVVFLSGKGDGNIKMYEVETGDVHHLTDYASTVPTFGLSIFPKWSNNVRDCEIARFLKLCGDYVEPLSFTVPRTRSELFQDDLFPPTRKTNEPAVTSQQWFSGVSKPLSTVDLKPADMETLSSNPLEKKEKKYDFNAERDKEDNRFTKEKLLDRYYNQMDTQKEEKGQVLKQDLMEGVEESEWDD